MTNTLGVPVEDRTGRERRRAGRDSTVRTTRSASRTSPTVIRVTGTPRRAAVQTAFRRPREGLAVCPYGGVEIGSGNPGAGGRPAPERIDRERRRRRPCDEQAGHRRRRGSKNCREWLGRCAEGNVLGRERTATSVRGSTAVYPRIVDSTPERSSDGISNVVPAVSHDRSDPRAVPVGRMRPNHHFRSIDRYNIVSVRVERQFTTGNQRRSDGPTVASIRTDAVGSTMTSVDARAPPTVRYPRSEPSKNHERQ